jgi:hypothetical protein
VISHYEKDILRHFFLSDAPSPGEGAEFSVVFSAVFAAVFSTPRPPVAGAALPGHCEIRSHAPHTAKPDHRHSAKYVIWRLWHTGPRVANKGFQRRR